MPFTDGTIRAVRFYADQWGSPAGIDARMRPVTIRGQELTGGVPAAERRTSRWWWALALVPIAAAVAAWRWRARRESS